MPKIINDAIWVICALFSASLIMAVAFDFAIWWMGADEEDDDD